MDGLNGVTLESVVELLEAMKGKWELKTFEGGSSAPHIQLSLGGVRFEWVQTGPKIMEMKLSFVELPQKQSVNRRKKRGIGVSRSRR